MSRVDTPAAFERAKQEAARYDACVLAERLIDGPEYTVAILGDRALPVIRIEAAREFYDYAAKYEAGTTRYHIPCGLDAAEEQMLGEVALRAFSALGCSIWGRVDVMRDRQGRFQLLEVNTLPGMTATSLVPMAAKAAGMTLLELLEDIMWQSWEAAAAVAGGER
jgi:D-alanine-D-alanine ligase